MTIEAKIVAHSSHPGCPDLITVQARYPRFVHAEAKTHRLIRIDDAEYEFLQEISLMDNEDLSRNASSSRAIPISRMIQDVLDDPAMPVAWGSNQPGMQAGSEIEDIEDAKAEWIAARDSAVKHADRLLRLGLHKQIVNRVLEPFGHISVVITATEWNNFFAQRCHPAADPTMRALANAMRDAIKESQPKPLELGQWHLPYGGTLVESAARCARVSYLRHDGSNPTYADDVRLAEFLREENHWSPFEHQAWPTPNDRHANLNGWQSQRTILGA
jgi:Thymidylate synthase complementing protein